MNTARIFQSGRSQAVRLLKEFRFTGAEVFLDPVTAEVLGFMPLDSF